MRNELQTVLMAVRELPAGELPRLLGELEEIRCTALARLTAPLSQPQAPDVLLNVDKAAERLSVSPSYLYRNHRRFAFTRHLGRKLVFSSAGIQQYIRSRA